MCLVDKQWFLENLHLFFDSNTPKTNSGSCEGISKSWEVTDDSFDKMHGAFFFYTERMAENIYAKIE